MAPLILGAGLELAKMFAPKLVGAIAGSKGEKLAQDFVDMVSSVTGEVNPEVAIAKLKEDSALMIQMQTLVIQREKEFDELYLKDKQDARARDVEVRKISGRNTRADWMVIGDVVGLVTCLAVLYLLKDATDVGEIRGIISTIAGFFGLGLRDAHQFEFGSSRGSKEKDEHIVKLGGK